MRCLALAALVVSAAGCGGDCTPSADVEVTVVPPSDIAVGNIAKLHVALRVANGPAQSFDIPLSQSISTNGSPFKLRPSPMPSAGYNLAVTLQALDGAGNLIAAGTDSIQAAVMGCNRLTVHLGGVSVNGDMAVPPGPIDMAMVRADLAGCFGGSPDEDQDGRANFCDLCPDDSDPTPADSDGDGLPDACDPDPMMGTNKLVYFEPFDSASGHWSTPNTLINGGMLTLDTLGETIVTSNNGVDMLPTYVRVQSEIDLGAIYTNTPLSDAGIFVGNNANPAAPNAAGVLCILHYHPTAMADTLDLIPVFAGTLGSATTTTTLFHSALYRMRLTQRASGWTCETTSNGSTPATVTLPSSDAVAGPLFMSLRSENMAVHFNAVVAESTLP